MKRLGWMCNEDNCAVDLLTIITELIIIRINVQSNYYHYLIDYNQDKCAINPIAILIRLILRVLATDCRVVLVEKGAPDLNIVSKHWPAAISTCASRSKPGNRHRESNQPSASTMTSITSTCSTQSKPGNTDTGNSNQPSASTMTRTTSTSQSLETQTQGTQINLQRPCWWVAISTWASWSKPGNAKTKDANQPSASTLTTSCQHQLKPGNAVTTDSNQSSTSPNTDHQPSTPGSLGPSLKTNTRDSKSNANTRDSKSNTNTTDWKGNTNTWLKKPIFSPNKYWQGDRITTMLKAHARQQTHPKQIHTHLERWQPWRRTDRAAWQRRGRCSAVHSPPPAPTWAPGSAHQTTSSALPAAPPTDTGSESGTRLLPGSWSPRRQCP